MPKLVDYSARFAFIREAAFTVVRDRGVGHLSRRAVAAELGLSLASVRRILDPAAPLELLAAAEVAARRDAARWRSFAGAGAVGETAGPVEELAATLAESLLPGPAQLAEEVVWLRLVLAEPHVTRRAVRGGSGGGSASDAAADSDGADVLSLRDRRQIADGCWTPEDRPHDREDRPDPLTGHVTDHREQLLATIRLALDRLGVEDTGREARAEALLALVSGLVLEICLGLVDPVRARDLLGRHLVDLAPTPGRPGSATSLGLET